MMPAIPRSRRPVLHTVLAVLLPILLPTPPAGAATQPTPAAAPAPPPVTPVAEAPPATPAAAPAPPAPTPAARPAPTPDELRKTAANFDFQELAPGVFAVIRRDPPGLMCDGNSVVIINESDVVVVDAPESSREVLAEIRRRTDKPVTVLVNTHWHDDHITGNALYREAFPNLEVVAHAATRDYLPGTGAKNRALMIEGAPGGADMLRGLLAEGKNLAGAPLTDEERTSYTSDVALVDHYMAVVPTLPVVLPTITLTDRLALQRGGRTIEILALGAGHTGGDIVVHLPAEGIVVAGDLVIAPIPLVGDEQSHVGDWPAALEKIRALSPRLIVPGHGPVQRDDAQLLKMERLFRSITTQVTAAVAAGRTLEETRPLVKLDDLQAEFAGDSPVQNFLFRYYVAGPAVAAAWREATEARR